LDRITDFEVLMQKQVIVMEFIEGRAMLHTVPLNKVFLQGGLDV
jgi:hypothetical protein